LPRPLLIKAIYDSDLSDQELAALMHCSRSFVNGCKQGKLDPSPYFRRLFREKLNRPKETYPDLFDVVSDTTNPRTLRAFMDAVKRDFLKLLASLGLSATGLFDNTALALVSMPIVEPQEYLNQASLALDNAEEHFYAGNLERCKLILNSHLPVLKRFSVVSTPFQSITATLALRGLIVAIQLATGDRRFSDRELFALDAIKYAALSDDPSLLALANYWYGDTFVYCYRQPSRAIPLLTTAMGHADKGQSSLIKAGIACELSIANGMLGNERGVLDHIQLAYDSMPSSPDLDPHSNFSALRQSELHQNFGKAYTELAYHIPSYGSLAYERACSSLDSNPFSTGYHTQALIRKAEASIVVDDMGSFRRCLLDSLGRSRCLNRFAQIHAVAHRVPTSWLKESSIGDLQRDASHALSVVSA
jgi:hypothetical protein